jgi:hypothetical protein
MVEVLLLANWADSSGEVWSSLRFMGVPEDKVEIGSALNRAKRVSIGVMAALSYKLGISPRSCDSLVADDSTNSKPEQPTPS